MTFPTPPPHKNFNFKLKASSKNSKYSPGNQLINKTCIFIDSKSLQNEKSCTPPENFVSSHLNMVNENENPNRIVMKCILNVYLTQAINQI